MSTAAITQSDQAEAYSLSSVFVSPTSLLRGGGILLLVSLALAGVSGTWSRFAHAYLLGLGFCLSISLGALFFVILQHLTNARWSVAVRRLAELLTSALPLLGLLFLPIILSLFFGSGVLYEWNEASVVAEDALIQHKQGFLNAPFFAVRCLIYFAAWIFMAKFFLGKSMAQDAGDKEATFIMRRYSGPSMIVFALTLNFASFDLFMSLDPHWFSTIYGVYYFAGCNVAFFASLPLIIMFVQSQGVLRKEITVEHFHDIAKLLFGFVFFWTYIAFSQYLLIWYANIPEETGWFAVRQSHGWQAVSLSLIFGHFALPFLCLMSRSLRRNKGYIAIWCVFLLVMHAVDLYWLVMPSVSPMNATPKLIDFLCVFGVLSLWLGITLRNLLSHRLLNTGDPRLPLSLAFHNV